MVRSTSFLAIALVVTFVSSFTFVSRELVYAGDWAQFRGPEGAGVAAAASRVPIDWDVENLENVSWSAELPGKAPSGPIVVRGRVFVTASSGHDQKRLHVLCFDAQSGALLWHRQMWATGRTLTHPQSSVAAPTPASDGERVFAFYSSNDLICLDLDGNLQWYRGLGFDYPKAGNDVGMASSPVVADDTVVVQIENQGDSFLAALDTRTGQTRWRTDRPKAANWSSPAIGHTRDGQSLVIVKSSEGVEAFDLLQGAPLWKVPIDAGGIASLVVTGDRIFVPGDGLTAFSLSTSEPRELWNSPRLRPSSASPVVASREVYAVNSAGVLTCGDLQTGELRWQLRLGGRFWATPVMVNEHLYCFNDAGEAKVVQLGREGEVVGQSELGTMIQGSPAVADNAIYVRSNDTLWKIAAPE